MRKRARTLRRRNRSLTVPRMMRQNIVFAKRTYRIGSWDASTTWNGGTTGQFVFQLNNLPNASEFVNLFEQYKINGVKLTFIPNYTGDDAAQAEANVVISGGPAWHTAPRIYTVIDKDGDYQTSTENAMLENNNARLVRNPYRQFTVYVKKPAVQFEVGTGAVFSQAAPKASPWLDCKNSQVNHYGAAIAGILSSGTLSAVVRYQVIATYYMAFKGIC